MGEHLFWQPRLLPYQCQYISLGDNVKVAAGVDFITHDVISYMLNDIDGCDKYRALVGCIEIGNNVMLGANVVIMPNIKIGSNVIVGAGAVVTKNIPDNTVYAGVPARFLMTFDDFCEKRKRINTYVGMSDEELWNQYEKEHYE